MQNDLDAMRAYTMTLARRAAKDIREDGFRQLRGYVDMGAALSRTAGHKYFFSVAQKTLEKADSLYYQLLQKALATVDTQRVCTLGVNVGIDCFTYSARQLREAREQDRPVPPWMVLFDTPAASADAAHSDPAAAKAAHTARIAAGEPEGIYLYTLACADTQDVLDAAKEAAAHEKSTFFLRLTPALVTDETAAALGATYNTIPVVELPGLAIDDKAAAACAALRAQKMFYGLFVPVAPEEQELLFSQPYLQTLADQTLLCICRNTAAEDHAAAHRLQKGVYKSRTKQCLPVVLMDYDADAHSVSKYMQSETQTA